MAAQVPPEVLGVAVGVLIYSLICLASGIFMLWMVWVHNERKSCKPAAPLVCRSVASANNTDVAMLGFFVSLHTLASVIQQLHTIVRWRDIKIEQHANVVANVGNPELNITGASTGLDLVLFYIRRLPAV
jgi:hypothetical protein